MESRAQKLNPRESAITINPLGAIITRVTPPNTTQNIVLSFSASSEYVTTGNPAYFGETIGRVANRIAGGRIDNLNGQSYELARNGDGGKNCLHGGKHGWGKRIWDGPRLERRPCVDGTLMDVQCWCLRSLDGDEGFPGTVEGRVWYGTRVAEKDGHQVLTFDVEYEVELLDEVVEETICALTNHSYFNLSSNPTVDGTQIKLATNLHLPTDDFSIPLGFIAPLAEIKPNETIYLGDAGPIFDHCFVVNPEPASVPLDTRNLGLKRLVTVYHPETKINLVIESTEPAFQLYTGDGIEVGGYGARAGIAVEPSRYINAVNNKNWRQMTVLSKVTGTVWGSRIRYTTWKG